MFSHLFSSCLWVFSSSLFSFPMRRLPSLQDAKAALRTGTLIELSQSADLSVHKGPKHAQKIGAIKGVLFQHLGFPECWLAPVGVQFGAVYRALPQNLSDITCVVLVCKTCAQAGEFRIVRHNHLKWQSKCANCLRAELYPIRYSFFSNSHTCLMCFVVIDSDLRLCVCLNTAVATCSRH
jgi:hypothetical protein